MRFLFYLGHPAHYHYISQVIVNLAAKQHEVLIVARPKDVLLDLIKDIPFEKIILQEDKKSKAFSILHREKIMYRIVRKFKPDVMIGTDIVITHIGKLLRIPSIVLSEDDASEIGPFVKYGYRFATHILAPASCDCTPYNAKQIAYPGCMEFNYLHPKYFTPNRNEVNDLFGDKERFFILRFAKLNAFHDKGRTGIDTEIAQKLIDLLEPHGNIYITSERELEPQFEKYRIKTDPRKIHHALHFAHLYIGDSQTMAAEAAVLGTPSVRFNDFVGKLGYLEELEHVHGLTYGIKTHEPEKLIACVEKLLNEKDIKSQWEVKRRKMFSEGIDVTAFWTWLFENYPNSVNILRQNKDHLQKFK